VLFETGWTDNTPKKIVVTMNGQFADSVARIIYEPGIDTISITLDPMIPGAVDDLSAVTITLFNTSQTYMYYTTADDQIPAYTTTYQPPAYFENSYTVNHAGGVSTVEVSTHTSDWNLFTAEAYDCGAKTTYVEVSLVDCSNGSVIETVLHQELSTTPNYYNSVFEVEQSTSDSARVRVRVLHQENGLATPGFDSTIEGVAALYESDCFDVGELSTGVDQIQKPSDMAPYPNPTEDICFISAGGKPQKVVVRNLSGQTIWTGLTSANGSVSLSDIPVGLYAVQVDTEAPRLITKL
jgi:hypothetical protein